MHQFRFSVFFEVGARTIEVYEDGHIMLVISAMRNVHTVFYAFLFRSLELVQYISLFASTGSKQHIHTTRKHNKTQSHTIKRKIKVQVVYAGDY